MTSLLRAAGSPRTTSMSSTQNSHHRHSPNQLRPPTRHPIDLDLPLARARETHLYLGGPLRSLELSAYESVIPSRLHHLFDRPRAGRIARGRHTCGFEEARLPGPVVAMQDDHPGWQIHREDVVVPEVNNAQMPQLHPVFRARKRGAPRSRSSPASFARDLVCRRCSLHRLQLHRHDDIEVVRVVYSLEKTGAQRPRKFPDY